MGRDATKAAGNPWYQARKKAAEYDDRLCSRESAAEQLGMSVSSLADAELGNTKFMPVDKAVLMADRYNAPWLLNHYCLNECPIGCRHSLSDEVVGIGSTYGQPDEHEFLLQRGTEFTVRGVSKVGDSYTIKMDVTGREPQDFQYATKEQVIERWKRLGLYEEGDPQLNEI